jgi:hypothetical protein
MNEPNPLWNDTTKGLVFVQICILNANLYKFFSESLTLSQALTSFTSKF